MPAPIRAIVARFSFDYSKEVIENVMKKIPFEHCAILSSGTELEYFASLPQEHQEWFTSGELRGCKYKNVGWATLDPIDEELIESMRECEAIFMEMVSRMEWKRRIPFAVRKRWYYMHLRFWNDYIRRNRVNLYLSAWMPHEIPDIVIYYLCKHYSIPVLYFECASMVRDTSFAERDWQESSAQIKPRYEALLKEYAGVTDPERVPLDPDYEERWKALTAVEGTRPPAYVDLPSYWQKVFKTLSTAPLQLLHSALQYFTPSGFLRFGSLLERRRILCERNAFYDAHAVEPDLNQAFVYLPLHYQPEASTTPMGGVFVQQVLMAQLLNAHLPDGILIYIKEHPRESAWLQRSIQFYEDLVKIDKVRLVARSVDTFVLRERCSAVATATGTAGVEALFRGKPVFLFGHRFYQYARGVHRIHSTEDCAAAVREIFTEGKRPTLMDCRLYLKAMEDTRVHGAINPWHYDVSKQPYEQHVRSHTEALLTEIPQLVG
jgi:hypothetical protein